VDPEIEGRGLISLLLPLPLSPFFL